MAKKGYDRGDLTDQKALKTNSVFFPPSGENYYLPNSASRYRSSKPDSYK
jgi:hypothetical protein